MFGFFFTFLTHKLQEHLVGAFTVLQYIFKHFQILFYDYDFTNLEIIHPFTSRNHIKHPIKVLQSKSNIM